MPLNIVITMAGRGSRFKNSGYLMPKYEIIANGKSLFDWALLSLENFIKPDTRVIFVCLGENNSRNFVSQRCKSLGLRNFYILELDDITNGQATSAFLSQHLWLSEEPLLIYNIDTFINPNKLKPETIQLGSDGWIPCFRASGDHWSFVKLGASGWATHVSEKSRISNLASIGLYWFRSAHLFSCAYKESLSDLQAITCEERYIAPLYNQLIFDGGKISVHNLSIEDVHVLGTPAELNNFLSIDSSQHHRTNVSKT